MSVETVKRSGSVDLEATSLLAPTPSQRAAAAGLAAAGFAALLVAELTEASEGADGLLVLHIFPVALLALAFGRRAGLLAAAIAVTLVAIWDRTGGAGLDPTAYAGSVAAFALVGPLLGYLVGSMRAAVERERLADEAFRRGGEALAAEFDRVYAMALVDTADDTHRLPRVNSTVVEVSGFGPRELTAMGLLDLVEPRGTTSAHELEQIVSGAWDGPPVEVYLRCRDGTRLECVADSRVPEGADASSRYVLLRLATLDAHGPLAASVEDPEPLTDRELEVLRHVAAGESGPAIAALLFVSPETVKSHLKVVYRKLGVSDRAAAVAVGMRRGLIR